MSSPESWANPNTTRSRVVLEIASELVAASDQPLRQAKVSLRESSASADWPLTLFGSNTIEGIHAVAAREAALAIVNPAAALSLAYRGSPPFAGPQPVRTIAVIPSLDQYVFAVKRETGLTTFEEIGTRRYPLKIAVRGTLDHSLHFMLDGIMTAAGFSRSELRTWGGESFPEGGVPRAGDGKFAALASGAIDAIFDEGSDMWLDAALDAGMTILPLAEATVRALEAAGYRRTRIEKERYPRLPADVLTIDFSGWPIFVHAELPDALVTRMCAGLDARKDAIPWQGEGPLPVERMCRPSPDTPLDVPLHPAAERFWRARGYL